MKLRTIPRLILRIAPLLVVLAAFSSCGSKESGRAQEPPPIKARTVQIQIQKVPEFYESVGTVRPLVEARVASKVMAAVEEIHAKAGDSVKEGDLLAKLDDRDLVAEFNKAKADFERFKMLLEKQAATKAEFDAMQTSFRVAETALSYARITAPFDGVVTQKLCNAGDMAVPGRPLFIMERGTDFRLEAQVPERLSEYVTVGKQFEVRIDATGEKCSGTIDEIIPQADPVSRSILVKIGLKCAQPLKTGMFGRAQLQVGERSGLFVPHSAVRERGQLVFVFVSSDGRGWMRLIKTGRRHGERIEVLSGLESGEHLVVSAEGELRDGQRIEEVR